MTGTTSDKIEILRLQGKISHEIAKILGIHESVVYRHIMNILDRLHKQKLNEMRASE